MSRGFSNDGVSSLEQQVNTFLIVGCSTHVLG